MSITTNEVIESFEVAEACAGAANCKKAAEAMCKFYALSNQQTIEKGTGLIIFSGTPPDSCSNQDQLFCQDNQ